MLWDLNTDYYLHHAHPRTWMSKHRRNYVKWFTVKHLHRRKMPRISGLEPIGVAPHLTDIDDYWLEYYQPLSFTSFHEIFSFKMAINRLRMPFSLAREGTHDLSPSRIETGGDHRNTRKNIPTNGLIFGKLNKDKGHNQQTLRTLLSSSIIGELPSCSILIQEHDEKWGNCEVSHLDPTRTPQKQSSWIRATDRPWDKPSVAQWTMSQLVRNSLNPLVTINEAKEYCRYIYHPSKLPLVIFMNTSFKQCSEYRTYFHFIQFEELSEFQTKVKDIVNYTRFLEIKDNSLITMKVDNTKLRYKAYHQWFKGKSLFRSSHNE